MRDSSSQGKKPHEPEESPTAYDLDDPQSMSTSEIRDIITGTDIVVRRLLSPPSRHKTHEFGRRAFDSGLAFRGGIEGATRLGKSAFEVLERAHEEEKSTLVWVPREDSDRFEGEKQ